MSRFLLAGATLDGDQERGEDRIIATNQLLGRFSYQLLSSCISFLLRLDFLFFLLLDWLFTVFLCSIESCLRIESVVS